MNDKTKRRFLGGLLATVLASPAVAQGFQENQRGTNILIRFKPEYEQYADIFARPEYAEMLATALITAERSRTRSGGDPDNNRPNSSEYEKVLTSAVRRTLRGLSANGVRLSDMIDTIQTEEASANHLSRAPAGSGLVTIRFTSTGPGRDYEDNLSARISAGGVDNSFGPVNFGPSRTGNQFTP